MSAGRTTIQPATEPLDLSRLERPAAERDLIAGMLIAIDREPARVAAIAAGLEVRMFADPIHAEIMAGIQVALANDIATREGVQAAIRRLSSDAGLDHGPAITEAADLIGYRFMGSDPCRLAELAAAEIREAHGHRMAALALVDGLDRIQAGHATAADLTLIAERLGEARGLIEPAGRGAAGLIEILHQWAKAEREPVVRTMFGPLDHRLGGGLPVGLTGIAAKPGEGKSALALQLTLGALLADRDARAVWFRGEMTNDLLAGKMLAIWSALRGDATPPATHTDARRRTGKARKVAVDLAGVIGDRFQVVDPPLTPEVLEREIVRHKPRLAVVDYLQLCEAGGKADRRAEVESVTRHLARLSTAHDVAIVVVSALAKATSEASGIGSLAKESNLLDYDVHTFLTLWSDGNREPDPREVRLKIEKSRTAIPGEIPLYFSGSGQYFTAADLADVEGYDEFAAFAPEALA